MPRGNMFKIMSCHACRSRKRRLGLTLVELMVVIVIMTILVTAVIPILSPSTKGKRIREAARQLHTTIAAAQTKSIGNNRRFGLWFERLSAETGLERDRGVVTRVFQCEEPQPYSGLSEGSSVILQKASGPFWSAKFVVRYYKNSSSQVEIEDDPLPGGLIRGGDRLVVRGATFVVAEVGTSDGFYAAGANNIPCIPDPNSYNGTNHAWNFSFLYPPNSPNRTKDVLYTFPTNYIIHRLPQKTAADPLELPAGVAIDLEASGDDGNPYPKFFHDPKLDDAYPNISDPTMTPSNSNDFPIIVMFNSDGFADLIYSSRAYISGPGLSKGNFSFPQSPNGMIHFLLTSRENVEEARNENASTPYDESKTSWMNLESRWVSISPKTGRVLTSLNAEVSDFGNAITDVDSAISAASNWGAHYKHMFYQRVNAREFISSTDANGGR